MNGHSAIELATRLLNVLETEQRESTYKQALVIALLQECISQDVRNQVSLLALADRFIDMYWHQLDPFTGGITLTQARRGEPQIPTAIGVLKGLSHAKGEWRPGRARTSSTYRRTQKAVAKAIASAATVASSARTTGDPAPGDDDVATLLNRRVLS